MRISENVCKFKLRELAIFRSSLSHMFFKISVLKNFTGKHLCWSLFLESLIKGLQHSVFL